MIEVTAAIIQKNNKILIAQRNSKDYLANLWEFPGGKIEQGENPEECLIREIKEEIDIEITVQDFFMKTIYKYDHDTIELLAYFVTWINGDIKILAHNDIRWVNISELDIYSFCPADIPIVNKLKELFK